MAVLLLGGTTFDQLAQDLPELPAVDDDLDQFTERSLVHLAEPIAVSVGGNAGNAAYTLARLGCRARLYTSLGHDLFGDTLEAWFKDVGCAVTPLAPKQTSFNFVATDVAARRYSFFFPVPVDGDAALDQLEDLVVGSGDHLMLAGYPHPDARVMYRWAERARGAGATVSVDIGPRLAGFTLDQITPLLPLLDVLFCNDGELAALAPSLSGWELKRLLAEQLAHGLVVKHGADGAEFIGRDEHVSVNAFPVRAAATVGAGDAFNAGYVFSWQEDKGGTRDRLRFAAAVAALVLERRRGVLRAPTAEEVRGFLMSVDDEERRTAMTELPRWATRLRERHPGSTLPSREDPIPDWLAEETARMPLWYTIREAQETRDRHPFLLHNEIHRQPDQWEEIVGSCWPRVEELADNLVGRGIRHVIFTGCESAFFTAIHGASTVPHLCGLRAEAIESFELANYFPVVDPATTLVVGHSGTGGSIETVQAMQAAARQGCTTLAITNTEGSAVVRASDLSLTYVTSQECGPCTSVVSTRILLQTMLAAAIGERNGQAAVAPETIRKALEGVADVGRDFLDREEDAVRQLARDYRDASSWLLVGSGPNYFSAREGTLKIEEQAILVGKGYRTGDFHHDALSLVAPERVVVAIEAAGAANERVVDAVHAANEGLSPTVAVTWSNDQGAAELGEAAQQRLHLTTELPELVVPIPMTLVFQLLGYYLGVERGFNPDTLRTDHEPNTRAWLTSFPLGTH